MSYIAITLDTSIFDKYQCQLESGILAELSQFNGMPTGVILSEVIVREVKSHLEKRIDSAKTSALGAIKTSMRDLLVSEDESLRAKEVLRVNEDPNAFAEARLAQFIKNVGGVIVPVEGNVKLTDVLSNYFSGNAPFSESGKKKNEFPDALSLMSLETWAQEHKGKILAVSLDKDWEAYAETSEGIDYTDNLAAALSMFQPTNDAVAFCEKLEEILLGNEDEPIGEIIKCAVIDKASEIDLWPEADSPFSTVEGDYVELVIDEVSLLDDIDIVPLQAQEHTLAVQARFQVESVATCDFSFSVYDSIDKDYVNMGGDEAIKEFDFEVDVLIHMSGDFSAESIEVEVEKVEVISSPRSINFGYIEPQWMSEPPE